MVDTQAENNPYIPPSSDSFGSRVKMFWRLKEEAEEVEWLKRSTNDWRLNKGLGHSPRP